VDDAELKQEITRLLREGRSLNDIHKHVTRELGREMTFLDLRLLISDLDVEMQDEPEPEPEPAPPPPPPPPAPGAGPAEDLVMPPGVDRQEAPQAAGGKTAVSVDAVARPGLALSGAYSTKSGASGKWFMDAYGRVGLEPATGSGKPDPADMQELQQELGKALRTQGGGF
jgi:hypothetical protein